MCGDALHVDTNFHNFSKFTEYQCLWKTSTKFSISDHLRVWPFGRDEKINGWSGTKVFYCVYVCLLARNYGEMWSHAPFFYGVDEQGHALNVDVRGTEHVGIRLHLWSVGMGTFLLKSLGYLGDSFRNSQYFWKVFLWVDYPTIFTWE